MRCCFNEEQSTQPSQQENENVSISIFPCSHIAGYPDEPRGSRGLLKHGNGLNPIAYYRLNETAPVPADTAANLGTAGRSARRSTSTPPSTNNPERCGSTDTSVGLNGSSQRVATPFDSSVNPTVPSRRKRG